MGENELSVLLNLALPIFLTFFFQFSLLLVSLIFLGHLPKEQQQEGLTAGAGQGGSFLNVTGVIVGNGVATTADTLCSQAFGYKNYERVGIILQRGILTLGLFLFPTILIAGAIVNVVAYYCIGIPLGVVLAFKFNMKLVGLWIGMLTGNIVQCAAFVIIILCTDWKKESEKAMKKAQGATSQDNERVKLKSKVIISKRGENASILDLDTSFKYSSDIRTKETHREDHEDKVKLLSKDSEVVVQIPLISSVQSPANKGRSLSLKKVLLHGSFYVVYVTVLIAGRIASHFKPYVDPEEYENCSSSHSSNATSAFHDIFVQNTQF